MLFRENRPTRLLSVVVAVSVLGIQCWAIATPSLWADEIATISAATRSPSELFAMLQHIDAVHGAYYLFMHFWLAIFGLDPFWLRFPSAVAVTLAVLVTWKFTSAEFGARSGWFALVLTATMPRLTWAATEGRSYAIDALIGVCLLWFFVSAAKSASPRLNRYWLGYFLCLTIGIYFFIYIVLLAISLGAWLLLNRRKAFRPWLLATAAAMLVSLPIIVWAVIEKGQVGWLQPLSQRTILEVFAEQAFLQDVPLALLATGLVLAFIIGARRPGGLEPRQQSELINLLSLGVIAPPAAVLAYSAFGSSIYDARYFTFSTPMVAILLSLALERLFEKRLGYLALALAVLLSLQPYFYFRSPTGKLTSWGALATMVERSGHAGDGILYADFDAQSPSLSRIAIGYPTKFAKLHDLTQVRPYYLSEGLYPQRSSIDGIAFQLPRYYHMLVLGSPAYLANYKHIKLLLETNGFVLEKRTWVYNNWISVFSKL